MNVLLRGSVVANSVFLSMTIGARAVEGGLEGDPAPLLLAFRPGELRSYRTSVNERFELDVDYGTGVVSGFESSLGLEGEVLRSDEQEGGSKFVMTFSRMVLREGVGGATDGFDSAKPETLSGLEGALFVGKGVEWSLEDDGEPGKLRGLDQLGPVFGVSGFDEGLVRDLAGEGFSERVPGKVMKLGGTWRFEWKESLRNGTEIRSDVLCAWSGVEVLDGTKVAVISMKGDLELHSDQQEGGGAADESTEFVSGKLLGTLYWDYRRHLPRKEVVTRELLREVSGPKDPAPSRKVTQRMKSKTTRELTIEGR